VGNAYQLATLFHGAAGSSLRRGWDGDARVYLQRAVPLTRQLDHPYQWMLVCGNVGVAALLAGDTEAARDAFREELTLGRELVVSPVASEALTGLAAIATIENELERAARLAGAAAAHRHGHTDDAVVTRVDATILEAARTRCGSDAWDAALRKGTALSLEDAIAYALDEPIPQAANPAPWRRPPQPVKITEHPTPRARRRAAS
jgi:hypothetical protein